jgi:hypothetical protein
MDGNGLLPRYLPCHEGAPILNLCKVEKNFDLLHTFWYKYHIRGPKKNCWKRYNLFRTRCTSNGTNFRTISSEHLTLRKTQGHYSIWHFVSLFTQTVWRCDRQLSAGRHSNLPWVWVHVFWFNISHLIFGSVFAMFTEGDRIVRSSRRNAYSLTYTL